MTTRDRIADAALELFVSKGFAATSVREIAAVVDVTVPALYYHFDSKDGLLLALVQPFADDGTAFIENLEGSRSARRADRALAGYFDVLAQHREVFRLVVADPSVRSHPLVGPLLADQGSTFVRLLVGDQPDQNGVVRVQAALGAIRRPLRQPGVDIVADRAQILASARAALRAKA